MHARHAGCPSRINLARFALPDFKTIQILHGDAPIGNDVQGVKLVFFNGEGLWLAGPSDNKRWFSPQALALIRRTHATLRRYADAFTSTDVTPLVPTLIDGVYANRFVGRETIVWTLYNANDDAVEGPVLAVDHPAASRYRDVWNDEPLMPRVKDNVATLELHLEAGDVGCIVQQR